MVIEYEKLYSAQEVAALLNMPYSNIRLWVNNGTIKHVRIGRRIRIPESALQVMYFPDAIMGGKETAEYLAISEERLDELARRRLIPFNFKNGTVSFSRKDIDWWLKSLIDLIE